MELSQYLTVENALLMMFAVGVFFGILLDSVFDLIRTVILYLRCKLKKE